MNGLSTGLLTLRLEYKSRVSQRGLLFLDLADLLLSDFRMYKAAECCKDAQENTPGCKEYLGIMYRPCVVFFTMVMRALEISYDVT